MTNGQVTNKDLYDAIHDLRKEISDRIDKIECKVDENTNWRNQITGKITVLMVVIGAGVNWFWDKIFNKS
jgi:hypothetical protein